jgi:hypothetical protein
VSNTYPVPQWNAPYPVALARSSSTVLARISVFCGIMSIFTGFVFLLPLLGLITGIISLAQRAGSPGRAITGVMLSGTFLLVWAGIIAVVLAAFQPAMP